MSETETAAIADAGKDENEIAFEAAVAKLTGKPEEPIQEQPKEPDPPKEAEAGDPPKEEAKPEEKPAEKKPEAKPETIDWSKVDPSIKAAYDAAEEKARRFQGMVQPLQRQNSDLTHKLRRVTESAKAEPGKADAGKPSADLLALLDSDRFKQALKDLPELEPFAEALKVAGSSIKTLETTGRSLHEERQADAVAKVEKQITDAHPDFYTDVVTNKDFYAWVKSQPAPIQNAARRNAGEQGVQDAQEVIDIVTMWKESTGAKSTPADPAPQKPAPAQDSRRQRQLATAAAPRSDMPARASTEPPPGSDPEILFQHAVQKIARQQGLSP